MFSESDPKEIRPKDRCIFIMIFGKRFILVRLDPNPGAEIQDVPEHRAQTNPSIDNPLLECFREVKPENLKETLRGVRTRER